MARMRNRMRVRVPADVLMRAERAEGLRGLEAARAARGARAAALPRPRRRRPAPLQADAVRAPKGSAALL
eukprot:3219589-Pleurochrysis_carterae.AAC.4